MSDTTWCYLSNNVTIDMPLTGSDQTVQYGQSISSVIRVSNLISLADSYPDGFYWIFINGSKIKWYAEHNDDESMITVYADIINIDLETVTTYSSTITRSYIDLYGNYYYGYLVISTVDDPTKCKPVLTPLPCGDDEIFTVITSTDPYPSSNSPILLSSREEITGSYLDIASRSIDSATWLTLIYGSRSGNDPYSDGEGDDGADEDGTGGPSDGGGGGGSETPDTWTDDSDDNPVPDLPSISAADTGFITLFNPTTSQLLSLAEYMWGDLWDIDTWRKVMSDPMDAIIGLSIVPVDVPDGSTTVLTVGNIPTTVSMTKAASQFVTVDCGTVSISEYYRAYLDYSPYTRASIYLPYIGFQEIDIDLIQGTTVGVTYHIDILSGACVAFVTVDSNVIMQFSGQCAVSIPITSQDFTQTIMSLGTLVASGVGVVATGGMSAPVQGAAIAGLATAAANTAANVISSKPTFAKSGNMSGSNGLMGVQYPYLIIEKPRQCAPEYQNLYTGYPSYIYSLLSQLHGFTQMQDVRLENISCSDIERDEILQLLRKGVLL